MGFKQRERKRKKKAAQIAAQKAGRSTGSAAGEWWRTVVVKDTCCAKCGGVLRCGMDMTYRKQPQKALCLICADRDPAAARPPAKVERAAILARIALGQRIEQTSLTVSEAARAWLERRMGQDGPWAPTTRERYERVVCLQIEARTDPSAAAIGECKLRDLTLDRVSAWSATNERTLAPTTARKTLVTLGQICGFAARRGWLADNPVARLEPAEKPRGRAQRKAILEGGQLALLLDHSGLYRPLFDFLAHTGLRIGEALGLTWADISFDAGVIRVHQQLSRQRQLAPLKTEAARREVVLAPALAATLRKRWLASRYKEPSDFVFANPLGRGLNHSNVREAFTRAVKSADLHVQGKLTLHSLRHTFASFLIASGLDVVFVSRQLGHANPAITLQVYAHLFSARDHAASARQALDASYNAVNGRSARRALLW